MRIADDVGVVRRTKVTTVTAAVDESEVRVEEEETTIAQMNTSYDLEVLGPHNSLSSGNSGRTPIPEVHQQ